MPKFNKNQYKIKFFYNINFDTTNIYYQKVCQSIYKITIKNKIFFYI
jgi:hypothetical protein